MRCVLAVLLANAIAAAQGTVPDCPAPKAPRALAECVLHAAPPQEKYPNPEYPRYWRNAVKEVAKAAGSTPAALQSELQAWAAKATDPLDRGIAALFLQRPADAIAPLRAAAQRGDPSAYYLLGRALYGTRQFTEARAAFERASNRSGNRALHWAWGFTLWELHDYAGAEQHLRRALQFAESIPLLNALALTLYAKPDFAGIVSLNQRMLALAGKQYGIDSPEYAEALHNSATGESSRGNSAAAEKLFQQALSITQKQLGARHVETAATLEELAISHYQRRDCAKAQPMFRDVLAIRRSALGDSHPAIAASYNTMGFCEEMAGNRKAAETWYQRALDLQTSLLGTDNFEAANYMTNLGMVKQPGGPELLRRSLRIQESLFGPDHPLLADTLLALALAVTPAEGEAPLARAIRLKENHFGTQHRDLATFLDHYAEILIELRKYAQAESALSRAIAILGRNSAESKVLRERLAEVRDVLRQ